MLVLSRLCCYPFVVMLNGLAPAEATPAPWSVERATDSAIARVELRHYALPSPNEMWEVDEAPIFSAVRPRPGGARGEVRFAGQVKPHRVGSLMLRPAGIPMYSRGDGGALRILTCRFDPEFFFRSVGLCDWDSLRLQRCAAIESRAIGRLANRLNSEIDRPGFASDLVVEALVQLLAVEIGRFFQPARPTMSRSGGRLARWQLARIEGALACAEGHWPTTGELAALCGVSRSHLSRAFVATTGTTLADYATTLRIERAQTWLRDTSLSLDMIAHRLGFSGQSAFGAAFRRTIGMSPLTFRRQAF